MLLAILSICSEEELTEDGSSEEEEAESQALADMTPADYQQRRQNIKNKIMAVGRMQRVFQLLRYVHCIWRLTTSSHTILIYREESEAASELVATEDVSSQVAAGLRVAPDALNVQGTQIGRNIRSFDDACVFILHSMLCISQPTPSIVVGLIS